jgi:hypothetical protein
MKSKLNRFLVCFSLLILLTGCGEVQRGIDKPVRVGGNRIVINHVRKTSEYTPKSLEISISTTGESILVVVDGEILGSVNQDLCNTPAFNGVELRWYDLSLFTRTRRLHCGLFPDDKRFVLLFSIPQKAIDELFTLYFPDEDISVRLWKSDLWDDKLINY